MFQNIKNCTNRRGIYELYNRSVSRIKPNLLSFEAEVWLELIM